MVLSLFGWSSVTTRAVSLNGQHSKMGRCVIQELRRHGGVIEGSEVFSFHQSGPRALL